MLTSASVLGQTPETAAPPPAASSQFDTTYRPSEVVALRVQRKFLSDVRWSVGEAMRDRLAEAFAERKPTEIWLDLVEGNGLTTNNVADALTAYWVLNWITANKAYDVKVEHGPIQAQVRLAMANDPNFRAFGDQQRQETAEGYVLSFLLEHAALNEALARQDSAALEALSAEAVLRFRRQMGIDLLTLAPGPDGFAGREQQQP